MSESFLLAKRISNLGLSCHDAGDLRDGEHFGPCSTPWNKNSVRLVILKPSCFRWVCHLVGGQAGPLGSKKKARATPRLFFFSGVNPNFFPTSAFPWESQGIDCVLPIRETARDNRVERNTFQTWVNVKPCHFKNT